MGFREVWRVFPSPSPAVLPFVVSAREIGLWAQPVRQGFFHLLDSWSSFRALGTFPAKPIWVRRKRAFPFSRLLQGSSRGLLKHWTFSEARPNKVGRGRPGLGMRHNVELCILFHKETSTVQRKIPSRVPSVLHISVGPLGVVYNQCSILHGGTYGGSACEQYTLWRKMLKPWSCHSQTGNGVVCRLLL